MATQGSALPNKPLEIKPEESVSNKIRELFANKGDLSSYLSQLGDGWYRVINREFAGIMIKLFSDEITNNILTSLMDTPLTIPQILQICESPQTSTYRKINFLIENGIILQKGYRLTRAGQRVHSYYSIINGLKIEFDKTVTVLVRLHWKN